jgi:pimeloyl-ACP methyl ester carboxylesterase
LTVDAPLPRATPPSAGIPDDLARGVRRRVVPLAGDRAIAFAEAGDGPPVVLIHGALMTLEDMWLPLAPHLSGAYRVVALDRPGHGLSVRRRLVDASPWRQAALIREALDALGVERPVIVGHSFGGTVALCYGLAFPEAIAGVVALAPLCFPEVRLEQILFGPRFVPGAGDLLASVLASAGDPALLPVLWRSIFLPQAMPEDFARRFPAGYASGPRRMVAEGEDAVSVWPALTRAALAYAACRVPVRILGGTSDIVVNNALNGLLAARMMPGARFRWLPGVGHMLHHVHPDEVAADVRAVRIRSGDAASASWRAEGGGAVQA